MATRLATSYTIIFTTLREPLVVQQRAASAAAAWRTYLAKQTKAAKPPWTKRVADRLADAVLLPDPEAFGVCHLTESEERGYGLLGYVVATFRDEQDA